MSMSFRQAMVLMEQMNNYYQAFAQLTDVLTTAASAEQFLADKERERQGLEDTVTELQARRAGLETEMAQDRAAVGVEIGEMRRVAEADAAQIRENARQAMFASQTEFQEFKVRAEAEMQACDTAIGQKRAELAELEKNVAILRREFKRLREQAAAIA